MKEKVKKPIWKKWWIWLIAIIVIISISGSSKDKKGDTSTSNSTSVEISSDTNKRKEEVKDIYNIGEEVKLHNNVLVVNSVDISSGSEWDKPKDGNEFLIVNVTIKNNGSDEISYNPFDFKIKNSKGQITDEAFTTINNDTSLSSGELAPGGEVSGTIVFQVPKNDTNLVLKYKANMFSNKEVKVKLNLKIGIPK